MVTETKINILDELDRHRNGLHLRLLAQTVKGSFPNVRRFVQLLEKEGVVKTEHQGNLLNIKLNDSISTLSYLKFVHTSRFLMLSDSMQKAINEFYAKLTVKPLIFLAFGLSSKDGKISDVKKAQGADVLAVFQKVENENENSIKEIASFVSKKYSVKINPIVVEYPAFERGFLDKGHALSNKIREDCIVLVGVEHYYNLLWRFLA